MNLIYSVQVSQMTFSTLSFSDFLPLSTTTHEALVNILKNWTFSYRDNTFLTILDQLRSVFHESKILVRKTALHGKLDTKFI